MAQKRSEMFFQDVVHFYTKISNFDKHKTIKHFVKQGKIGTSVHHMIQRFEQKVDSNYMPKKGRIPKVANEEVVKKVVNY